MIGTGSALSVTRQAKLLSVSRSSVYYRPKPESEEELDLLKRLDELFTENPMYGSRRLQQMLKRDGVLLGRRRVRRLMRKLGPQALFAQVLDRGNLRRASKQVRRNKGAPGIDGMPVDELPESLYHHGLEIRAQLQAGSYRPQPVLRADIPKGDGKTRLLGIPTVLDRFIQQAIGQVVSAQWEPHFHDHSYGFVRCAHPSPGLGTIGCADVLHACGAGRPQRSALQVCAKCRRTSGQATAGWWIWTCKPSSTGSIRTG